MKARATVSILLLLAFLSVLTSACNGVSDSEKQLAEITGQAQTDANVQDRHQLKKEAERELAIRQRFYQGVAGVYEGTAQVPDLDGNYHTITTRLSITPTVPEYSSNRYRTLPELQNDLANLSFDVMVYQEVAEPSDLGNFWKCSFMNVVPDLRTGTIHLQASQSECQHEYDLALTLAAAHTGAEPDAAISVASGAIAQSLLSESMTSAPAILMTMDPDANPTRFIIKRAKR